MAFDVKLLNFSPVQRFLLNVVPKTKREIKEVTETVARLGEADAKQRAPVDTGKLRQGISFELIAGGFGFILFSSVPYSVIVEMGTGALVQIPDGFEELAASYKGKGIKKVNLPARPFMVPAFLIAKERYYQGIGQAIDRIFA